ncbi:MAG: hypothetical protein KY410_10185, partial [Proteobacteria bacterium]|nr:hypothetical protein [Pseudomonadota bacterium]
EDGMHPGKALSILMAAEIHRTIFSTYPLAADISTTAPLFVPRDKLEDVVVLDALPAGKAKDVITAEQFEKILTVLRALENAG